MLVSMLVRWWRNRSRTSISDRRATWLREAAETERARAGAVAGRRLSPFNQSRARTGLAKARKLERRAEQIEGKS
jgi:hypothetical protein